MPVGGHDWKDIDALDLSPELLPLIEQINERGRKLTDYVTTGDLNAHSHEKGVINLNDWTSVDPTGTNSSAKEVDAWLQAGIDNGGAVLVAQPGEYAIDSSITKNDMSNIHIIGRAGPRHNGDAAVRFVTDQAIYIFDFGTTGSSVWNGPTIENIGFRDVSGSGTALGGLRFTRHNCMVLTGLAFADFEGGDGLHFAGGADWCQYIILIDPRIFNCKYGIHKTGALSDVQVLGGRLKGVSWGESIRTGSKGYYDASGKGGRVRFWGTGFNSWEVGAEVNKQSEMIFYAVACEQESGQTGSGTGISIVGGAASDEGRQCRIDNCHFGKFGTGISIGSNALRTQVIAPSYSSCTTNLSDSGKCTTILGGSVPVGDEDHGFVMAFQKPDGTEKRAGLKYTNQDASTVKAIPVLLSPENIGFLVRDLFSNDGGVYICSQAADDGIIGAGVAGDQSAPKATDTDAFYIRFDGSEMTWHASTGHAAGDTIGIGANKVGGLTDLGALMIKDGISTPSTLSGFAKIFVDSADGDLKVKFGDGTVKLIVADT